MRKISRKRYPLVSDIDLAHAKAAWICESELILYMHEKGSYMKWAVLFLYRKSEGRIVTPIGCTEKTQSSQRV